MLSKLYPFSAIVGQEELKLSLLLNAVNPKIGGVLIRGEKGTAKSTTVRALGALLPDDVSLAGACHRSPAVVTLPLNATEDMVAGGIDFQRTMKDGLRVFQPGLLSRADGGILYVDEVNLLDDHIVDIVLDAAASKENRVEREGISFVHPASFVLVGTMNPEEGELRPQLLDRFGLCVEVTAERESAKRVELMVRREAFDADEDAFIARYRKDNERITEKITQARNRFAGVTVPSHMRGFIAALCSENNVAGHRADLVIEQAAAAYAAYRGFREISVDDITAVAALALAHRRRDPVPPPPDRAPGERSDQEEGEREKGEQQEMSESAGEEQNENAEGTSGEKGLEQGGAAANEKDSGENDLSGFDGDRDEDASDVPGIEQLFDVGKPFTVRKIHSPKDRKTRRGSGRRSRSRVSRKQGRYTKSTMKRTNNDIALDATLRAAAPFQRHRDNVLNMAVVLKEQDIREKIREKRLGNLLIFVVDASGSMGAKGRMVASKGAVMSLLIDAYQKRDKIALVSFRKDGAAVNLPVTSSVELAATLLKEMPVGGRTPLSAGMVKGYEIARNYLIKEPEARPILIVVTDGKANKSLAAGKPIDEVFDIAMKISMEERIRFLVVDTEEPGLIHFGLAGKIAGILGAEYYKIDDLQADSLLSIVKNATT